MTSADHLAGPALELAWREHWGRLVAVLIGEFRRMDLAEDALADAFTKATVRWPIDSVPDNPAAWLRTAARRRLLDMLRADAVAGRKQQLLVVEAQASQAMGASPDAVPDDRLRLVLLCCHPAIGVEAQAALALRLVLGISTAEIARLFLVADATIGARLTRAKRKIAGAGVPFALPPPDQLQLRVDTAVRTVYLAFTAGYAPGQGPDLLRADLAGEAIRLARVLDELVPDHAPVRALLALMLFQHARRDARVRGDDLVLLADQDRRRWHHDEIAQARGLLAAVPPADGVTEELRLQAMIAELHATSPDAAATDWTSIAGHYARLETLTGSPVVRLNRAVAVAEVSGPAAGLAMLEGLTVALARSHRLPAVRAELLLRAGDPTGARRELLDAIERCRNDAERRHLHRRLDIVSATPR